MSDQSARPGTAMKLSVMMFLQFFTWGAWFATLGQCLATNNLLDFAGDAYGSAPLGAIFAPLFLGLIADRFFPSQKVMGVLFLISGALLMLIPGVAGAGEGKTMTLLMLGIMLAYMPTLGLGNTVAFSNLDRNSFPKVRVWGTIGWIAAGLTVGALGWTSSLNMFYLAGGCSLLLGVYSFFLPHTPAPAKGEPINMRALFMVDAFKMLAVPSFMIFMLCSMLICVPLAYYFGLTGNYLTNAGFEQAASFMTIGQMSEIFFMLLIPFFFRKLGVKWMIVIGMLAWVARYLLFAFGAPDQLVWMIFLGVALHGICYDFFFVTGFMYADRAASKAIRGQVQSMLVFFTQGLGMWVGYKVAFSKVGSTVPDSAGLGEAIAAARGVQELSFWDKLAGMFAVDMPAAVDRTLLGNVMDDWKEFWILPAMMAGGIAVLFFLLFVDKTRVNETDEEVLAEAAEAPEEMP
ncbi:MAG: MFS transporter [Verrucomicrobia bacterium]|nr:MFS transporter [Verrucomicrobiota bacterium]MDA1005972.1 MFS transporter [Verrucomicrobiota bacterium]